MFFATEVEHLMPTFMAVSGHDLHGRPATKDKPAHRGLNGFMADAEADFSAAERVDANSRASVTEYKQGQALRVISGPFVDMLVTFEKLVKAPHGKWQALSVESLIRLMFGGHDGGVPDGRLCGRDYCSFHLLFANFRKL